MIGGSVFGEGSGKGWLLLNGVMRLLIDEFLIDSDQQNEEQTYVTKLHVHSTFKCAVKQVSK